jgi:hypothetical protein
MTQRKMVQPGTRRPQEEREELVRNNNKKTLGRYWRLLIH